MACLIGAAMCGAGLGIVFNCNGSTGGTDIIAAIIHKYKDVTLGRMVMACDFIIISSCYVVFHDWRRVIFGFVTLFVIGFVLDYIVNSARQSVQFFIFSKEYEKIADRITKETQRGVTAVSYTHLCYHLGMGRNVSRSSLARANGDRDYHIFEAYAYYLSLIHIFSGPIANT